MAWRKITPTTPKDRRILVAWSNGPGWTRKYASAEWRTGLCPNNCGGRHRYSSCRDTEGWLSYETGGVVHPTHWMPLREVGEHRNARAKRAARKIALEAALAAEYGIGS